MAELKIMIKIILILSILIFNFNVYCQEKSNEFRIGVLSYKSEGGIGGVSHYQNQWMIYPEFIYVTPIIKKKFWLKFGFGFKENLFYQTKSDGFSGEHGKINIYKGLIGMEQKYETKLITLIYGTDLEYEKSNIKGQLLNDVGPFTRQINHKKNSINFQPYIGIRKVILSKLIVFVETGFGLRISDSKSKETNTEIPDLGPFLDVHYNPINSIGLIYKIK